ncbi:MAG: ABC transporter ATP-binding protein [Phycisphaerae bacterium]|jgi:ABC-2 type transport system ATP-binding protein
MSEPLLSLRHVRVQYGRFLAVDDLSFDLRGGELLGLIGPNGAGKTTTLRAATGLQPISTGHVTVLGHDVFEHATEVGQHLALAPDTPALYDALKVDEYLEFIARCYGLPRGLTSERIDHWLEQLWLSEKRRERVGSLSRGMKQRLAVARTLLPDPHVVLMDEPAAGLDPAGRVQFRRLLASLRDQGKALIVSSHILADLSEVCTHIAMMEHGRLRSFGTVAEVAGGSNRQRSRYRIMLVQRVGDVATRLADVAGITEIEADGDLVTLEYDEGRAAAARLLAALLTAGLPVAEFGPERPDLEQAYLRSGIKQVD